MVETGGMPPEDAPRPTVEQREAFLRAVRGVFARAARDAKPDPGRVTMRRLNRTEYRNTIRDLAGVDFDPASSAEAANPLGQAQGRNEIRMEHQHAEQEIDLPPHRPAWPYPFIEVPEGHHELSHHSNDQAKKHKLRLINTFHVTQLAYLLEKLKSAPEGDGALLDHAMIAYGSGNSDGNRHNHDDLPILLAGSGCGTLKSGRHIRYPNETPLTNLWLAIL